MADISILLVGSTDRSEFREARAALDALGEVTATTDAEAACLGLESGQLMPDVIVVAQAHPGQFSNEVVDRLQCSAPLVPVVGLLGSWCEGETRSGQPWSAVRVYWHQWPAQAEQEIARLRAGTGSTWSLPVTASEEERLLLLAEGPVSQREGLIAIWASEFAMHDWLQAACARHGYSTVWALPHRPVPAEGVTAAVFDGNECRGEERASLEQLAAALGPAPIIALLDFPRVDGRNRALSAGARAVLSKPLLIDDLFWQIDRLLESQSASVQA